jgi:hypothetical protein
LRRDAFVGQTTQEVNNFKVFLIEFGFAVVGCDGEMVFDKEMMRWILNIDATDIFVGGSKMMAGGRLEVSFHDPHLPLPSLSSAKSLHSCTGILGSNAAGECVPVQWQLPLSATAEGRARLYFKFLRHVLNMRGRFGFEE